MHCPSFYVKLWNMVEDKLLTVEQVAERLQMHAATVRRFIREGKLAGIRLGGREWRVKSSEMERFIEGGERPATKGE